MQNALGQRMIWRREGGGAAVVLNMMPAGVASAVAPQVQTATPVAHAVAVPTSTGSEEPLAMGSVIV